jgi:3-hydroxybutyryl-CoA dehydrogenase
MDIKKMGVIGAGQMGTGIAQVCALADIEVALNDISESRINAGLATIAGNLARQVDRKQLDPSARDAALNRSRPRPTTMPLLIATSSSRRLPKMKLNADFSKLCPSRSSQPRYWRQIRHRFDPQACLDHRPAERFIIHHESRYRDNSSN